MGRRALPKMDPAINFDRYLVQVSDLASPFDPQSLFPKSQPLEIEVGSGKGHFLSQHSQKNPSRNYLGNELAAKYARFAAYRLAKQNCTNARMIAGDGLQLFHSLLPEDCATDVHVYFPDPWWKERHRRRRVIQPEFVSDVERVLNAGGCFHFWTDVEEYFEETKTLIASSSNLNGPFAVTIEEPQHDMDYQTHFDRRMRIHGHDVFRARFEKRVH